MKYIILKKEQAEKIKGKYGSYSAIDPIPVYRQKYLLGKKVPMTEIQEYALPLEVLNDADLKLIKGFLNCFPIYDADYYIKEIDDDTKKEIKRYCDKTNNEK